MTGTPPWPGVSKGPARLIFPYAVQANMGQLSNLAAVELTGEGYGSIACVAKLAIGDERLVKSTKKIALAQGVVPAQHVVVTDLGIAKGPSKSCTPEDVETVVCACWQGIGRDPGGTGRERKSDGAGCGCGGGC